MYMGHRYQPKISPIPKNLTTIHTNYLYSFLFDNIAPTTMCPSHTFLVQHFIYFFLFCALDLFPRACQILTVLTTT